MLAYIECGHRSWLPFRGSAFFESERGSRTSPIFYQSMTHPLELDLIPLDRAVATEAEAMFKFFR